MIPIGSPRRSYCNDVQQNTMEHFELFRDAESDKPLFAFPELYEYNVYKGPIVGFTEEETLSYLNQKLDELVQRFGTKPLEDCFFFNWAVTRYPPALFKKVYEHLENGNKIKEVFDTYTKKRDRTPLQEAASYHVHVENFNPEILLFLAERHKDLLSVKNQIMLTPASSIEGVCSEACEQLRAWEVFTIKSAKRV